MTTENRVWLASALSVVAIVLYMKTFPTKIVSYPQSTTTQTIPSGAQQTTSNGQNAHFPPLIDHESVSVIENEGMQLKIGSSSGAVRSVLLKKFRRDGKNELAIWGDKPLAILLVGKNESAWTIARIEKEEIILDKQSDKFTEHLAIKIDPVLPKTTVSVSVFNKNQQSETVPLQFLASWTKADQLNGRNNPLEVVLKSERQHGWQRQYLRYFPRISEFLVPRGTYQVTLSERYFCQSIIPDSVVSTTLLPSDRAHQDVSVAMETQLHILPRSQVEYAYSLYFGPRDFFSMRSAGFSDAFPLGFLSKIGLVLILVLKWVASVTHSYGVALILLSIAVTACLSPFTLASFRSMKKMQELQPKLDQIRKKHQNDAVRMNQETFALFKEHRVSPLSGCLPMFLQLPVFFAIWSAISHFIDIRGERFLWIKDLSMPDRLVNLPFGFELNLLPIVMAAAMYAQSRMTQRHMPSTDSNPSAKLFSGPLMSIMFGVMFYSFPAGLVLYWLSNSVTSLLFYRMAKA